jgi:menaquinone-dependent protoporphyrinogen oxidase
MAKILVTYATAAGSTGEVAEAIGKALGEQGAIVDVRRAKEVDDASGYDAVILGTGVRAGRTYAEAGSFLKRHEGALSKVPVACFVVCATMKEDTEDSCREASSYLEAMLEATPGVQPVSMGTFAGVIDFQKLPWLLSTILKVFMKEPGGDYRDWEAIRAWAVEVYPVLADT